MRYYKLEKVQAALRDNGATGGTVVDAECTELWEREVVGIKYRVALTWQDRDQILSEEEVRAVLHTLFVKPIMDAIERNAGRWI